MTMKQFYSVPIGTCVRCGLFGTGVVAKREMVDTFLRRFDGKIGMKLVEPGVYQFTNPYKPVLLMTVRMRDGREEYFAETNPRVVANMQILTGAEAERFFFGQTGKQMSLFV